jgi:hypothetical protein
MNPAYTKAVGLEGTFEFFRDLMKESHFDGVFGMRSATSPCLRENDADLIFLFQWQSRRRNGSYALGPCTSAPTTHPPA